MLDLKRPIAGFDEKAYLRENPDVARDIETRRGLDRFRTKRSAAWRHFVHHGYEEYRPGVSRAVYLRVQDDCSLSFRDAIPPARLRGRVNGAEDLNGFNLNGLSVSRCLFDHLTAFDDAAKPSRIEPLRVLDFGVGCGRILRPLYDLCAGRDHLSWAGSDIDAEAIDWCNTFIQPIGDFVANGAEPPMPFPNGWFDFIYSISIFTHLPEAMQHAWLADLKRVSKPSGLLYLTVHGPQLVPEEHREAFRQNGFFYLAGPDTQGLPGSYQTAFHSPEYIRNEWGKYFEITEIQPRAINGHQDAVVCRAAAESSE